MQDFLDLFLAEFGKTVLFAAKDTHLACSKSIGTAFRKRIVRIVFSGAEKKMSGVHARRVIALVQGPQALGNLAERKNPREPVSVNVLFRLNSKNTVTVRSVGTASPDPARSQFGTVLRHGAIPVHFRPKTLGGRALDITDVWTLRASLS